MPIQVKFCESQRAVVVRHVVTVSDSLYNHEAYRSIRQSNRHEAVSNVAFPRETVSTVLERPYRGIEVCIHRLKEGYKEHPHRTYGYRDDPSYDWKSFRLPGYLTKDQVEEHIAKEYPGWIHYNHDRVSVQEEATVNVLFAFRFLGAKAKLARTAVHTAMDIEGNEHILSYELPHEMSKLFVEKCQIKITF